MADFNEFRIQTLALGLVPQQELSLESIWQKARELTGNEGTVNLDTPELSELWSLLRAETLQLAWPESEYQPEPALQKRVLHLADERVGSLPTDIRIEDGVDEQWEHLFLHGKLGLMATLFAFEQKDKQIIIKTLGPLVERFMEVIEKGFETLLRVMDRRMIAKCLRLQDDENMPFEVFVHGRLQPFSLMRSLYLEEGVGSLRPLSWWVMHERMIPDLPLSRSI